MQPDPRPIHRRKNWFHHFAAKISLGVGSPYAFFIACAVIVVWAATGRMFHYSDTWQLIINTGTTIVTFLMVFLIQNAQNRDARAIHLKLDELLRAVESARTGLIDLEDLEDEDLDELQREFAQLRRKASQMKNERRREA